MPTEVIEVALEQMTLRNPELRNIVTAVREPGSEAARARRELFEELGY